jgi:hypothetical protein
MRQHKRRQVEDVPALDTIQPANPAASLADRDKEGCIGNGSSIMQTVRVRNTTD